MISYSNIITPYIYQALHIYGQLFTGIIPKKDVSVASSRNGVIK